MVPCSGGGNPQTNEHYRARENQQQIPDSHNRRQFDSGRFTNFNNQGYFKAPYQGQNLNESQYGRNFQNTQQGRFGQNQGFDTTRGGFNGRQYPRQIKAGQNARPALPLNSLNYDLVRWTREVKSHNIEANNGRGPGVNNNNRGEVNARMQAGRCRLCGYFGHYASECRLN